MSRRKNLVVTLFCLPSIVIITAFFIYPSVMLCVDSLFQFSSANLARKGFVGLDNYISVFTSNRFWLIVWNTLRYVSASVSMEFILGMLLALMLSAGYKLSGFIRTALLFPLMMAPLVAGLTWKFMLSDQFGIINLLLTKLGLLENQHSIMWLSSKEFSLLSCVIADVWLTTPFMMLVLLAGIKGLDKSHFEAASLDGASKAQEFLYITLPGLRPVMTVALLIRIVDAIRSFDVIYAMTQGGPDYSSEIISTYIYRMTIRQGRIGSASAMAVFFIAVTMLLAELLIKRLWNPQLDDNA